MVCLCWPKAGPCQHRRQGKTELGACRSLLLRVGLDKDTQWSPSFGLPQITHFSSSASQSTYLLSLCCSLPPWPPALTASRFPSPSALFFFVAECEIYKPFETCCFQMRSPGALSVASCPAPGWGWAQGGTCSPSLPTAPSPEPSRSCSDPGKTPSAPPCLTRWITSSLELLVFHWSGVPDLHFPLVFLINW